MSVAYKQYIYREPGWRDLEAEFERAVQGWAESSQEAPFSDVPKARGNAHYWAGALIAVGGTITGELKLLDEEREALREVVLGLLAYVDDRQGPAEWDALVALARKAIVERPTFARSRP